MDVVARFTFVRERSSDKTTHTPGVRACDLSGDQRMLWSESRRENRDNENCGDAITEC
jgi:hypothetical protein